MVVEEIRIVRKYCPFAKSKPSEIEGKGRSAHAQQHLGKDR
jgi:hypothetical protein